MAQTILLTGGLGFIGSHTFVALTKAGFHVVIVDDLSNARPITVQRLREITQKNDVTFHQGSVLDRAFLDRVFTTENIDAVIHFAAKKAVGESMTDPVGYMDTNIGGLLTLLQAMKKADVMTLVFSSSATVYGAAQTVPTPEDSPLSATNTYGFTKLAGEQILAQAMAADPWCVGVLRYFNPVGAHPSGLIGEDPTDTPNNLVPYIAKVATGELATLQVFGDDYPTKDGTGERDYVHVMDLAEGHVLSVKSLLERRQSHTVNLGTGRACSVLEVIAAYARASGKDIPYTISPRRDGDVTISQADVSKAKDVLGFEARFTLDDMCASSWHWINTGASQNVAATPEVTGT